MDDRELCVSHSGFVRCKFGPGTKFHVCRFEGSLDLQGAEGVSDIALTHGCSFSPEARAAFQRILKREGPPVTEEQIRDCISDVLKLFGQPGRFHPVAASARRRGRSGASPIAANVWEALSKNKVISRNAFLTVMRATGSLPEPKPEPDTRNQAAVALGKLGAAKGGKARAKALSARKRKEIAKKAAQARWRG